MRFLRSLVLVAAWLGTAASASAAGSWLVPNHDAQSTNFNAGAAITPVTVARYHRLWHAPGVVQAIAADRWVYAIVEEPTGTVDVAMFEASTGRRVRTFTAASLRLSSTDVPDVLAYASGQLIVGSGSVVTALDPFHGRVTWQAHTGATRLTVAGAVVYTGKSCQDVCGPLLSAAIDLRTGRVLWRHPGGFGGQPVLIGGHLYQDWGFGSGRTRVYDPVSGQQLAGLALFGDWTGDVGNAFVMVKAVSPARSWIAKIGPTGRPVWRKDLGRLGMQDGPPVYTGGALFAPSNRFSPGIVAIGAGKGTARWARDLGANLDLVGAGHLILVLHRNTGVIGVLQAGTGQAVGRMAVPGYGSTGPGSMLVAGSTVYVISGSGLTALRA